MANMLARALGVGYIAEYRGIIVTEAMSTHRFVLAR